MVLWVEEKMVKWSVAVVIMMILVSGRDGYRRKTSHPIFNPRPGNVTFSSGDTAELKCSISNLGTKTVLWRKLSDNNPLLIGQVTFVADKRFVSNYVANKEEWNLLIHNVQPADSGVYICKVSAKKKQKHRVMLTVTSADRNVDMKIHQVLAPHIHRTTGISVSGTRFVEKGDPIYLVCNATGTEYPPQDIDWFRDGNKMSADSHRSMKIFKFHALSTKTLTSTLTIRHSEMEDGGTYVCRSSDLEITSIKVHVLNAGTNNVKRTSLMKHQVKTQRTMLNIAISHNRHLNWIAIVLLMCINLL